MALKLCPNKTALVLNWVCWLTQVDLCSGCGGVGYGAPKTDIFSKFRHINAGVFLGRFLNQIITVCGHLLVCSCVKIWTDLLKAFRDVHLLAAKLSTTLSVVPQLYNSDCAYDLGMLLDC